ncbi:MAG: DUF2461 domain-containing protein [Firmicutes bacterium]|nr:DUF2461 domain-containing protein [Bacillota bacterium]
MTNLFNGFKPETLKFFADLSKNNEKVWFDEHREDYDEFVMLPTRNFIVEMGNKLSAIVPLIVADPKVNRSIFRINRDVRFSNDKRPYKTHLGIWFWEGNDSRMDNPGFYFHIEPGNCIIAAGMHCFSKPVMNKFREMVVHPKMGPRLPEAVEKVSKSGQFEIGEKTLKKTPRGFDSKHPNAEYLLYTGFNAFWEGPVPEEVFSADIIDYCMKRFQDMLPIHQWLVEMKNY